MRKMYVNLRLLQMKGFIMLLASIISFSTTEAQTLTNYSTSWLGNTFGIGRGQDSDNYVQNFVEEIEVSSDNTGNGTVFTASFWDESGRCAGIYKDGSTIIKKLKQYNGTGGHTCWGWGTSGETVAVDNSYVYLGNCEGKILRFERNNEYNFKDQFSAGGEMLGMTAKSGKLYLTLKNGNIQIRSTANVGSVLNSFNVPKAKDIAIEENGNIWILADKTIKKYNASNIYTGVEISGPSDWDPTSVSISNNGGLIVCDNGPRAQVFFYNISGTPVVARTFGDLGGIAAGTPGVVTPTKLWGELRGAATDANGNLYVALSGVSTSIRKYTTQDVLAWEVQNHTFVDCASVDPASDGNDIYGVEEHYSMDLSKANGQEWKLKGFTLDKVNNPTDPRLQDVRDLQEWCSARMRRVNGKLLMYSSSQMASHVGVWRYDGEVAKFVQKFNDLGWAIFPDKNGNIWYEQESVIYKIPLTDFTNTNPVFGSPQSQGSKPESLTSVERIYYDVDNDVMYMTGYTSTHRKISWGLMGSVVKRYNNWSAGNRTESYTIVVDKGTDTDKLHPKDFTVAGDYIFTAICKDPKGRVYVYSASTGAKVGHLDPGSEIGGSVGNWVDMAYGISAFKRSNGEYMVITEEVGGGKNILYRWCPTGNCDNGTAPVVLRNPENPSGSVAGIDYKYFEGTWGNLPDFSNLTPSESGTASNFDLSVRNRDDNFGVSYTGYIDVPIDGQYTFYTTSDDGSNVYIGNTLVVNNDGLHGPQEGSGSIGLKQGKHAIRVDFFEQGGGEVLTVSYAGPGISKQLIPAASLYRVPVVNQPPTRGTNIALNKPVLDQSSQQASNVATQLVDGSTANRWSADVGGFPQWVVLDLGESYNITGTEFLPYNSRAYKYKVEVSESPTTGYTLAVDRTSNTEGGEVLSNTVSGVAGRYVKLTVTGKHTTYRGRWVSVLEFRVFGTATNSGGRLATDAKTAVAETVEPVVLYPNPASEEITVSYDGMVAGRAQVVIVNQTGTVVRTQQIVVASKAKSFVVHVKGLKSGVYEFILMQADKRINSKFIIAQ